MVSLNILDSIRNLFSFNASEISTQKNEMELNSSSNEVVDDTSNRNEQLEQIMLSQQPQQQTIEATTIQDKASEIHEPPIIPETNGTIPSKLTQEHTEGQPNRLEDVGKLSIQDFNDILGVAETQQQTDNDDPSSLAHTQEQLLLSPTRPVTTSNQLGVEEQIYNPEIALDNMELINDRETSTSKSQILDNGIFDFMTPDRAIELYNRIHNRGIPELDWKFYGRRKPGQPNAEELKEPDKDTNDDNVQNNTDYNQDNTLNTEFDFDEDFGDLPTDTSSIVTEGLQLKKRLEPGSDRKTNLSDIMSDIMKESQAETE